MWFRVVLCKKPLEKTLNIQEMGPFLKIGHLAKAIAHQKGIAFGKLAVWVKNLKCEKRFFKIIRVVLWKRLLEKTLYIRAIAFAIWPIFKMISFVEYVEFFLEFFGRVCFRTMFPEILARWLVVWAKFQIPVARQCGREMLVHRPDMTDPFCSLSRLEVIFISKEQNFSNIFLVLRSSVVWRGAIWQCTSNLVKTVIWRLIRLVLVLAHTGTK